MFFSKLPKNVLLSYAALFVSYLIWSAAGPVIKITLAYIPPVTFLFLRFLLVCLILLPYTIYQLQRVKIDHRDLVNIVLLGLFSQTSIIFIFLGLEHTTALDAVLIGMVGPLLSVAAGHYFYNDKMNKVVKLGTLLAVIGTFIVAVEPVFSGGNVAGNSAMLRVWGNFLVILNNVAFLVYIIWSKISLGETTPQIRKALHFMHLKPMIKKYSGELITALSFYIGLASMMPFAFLENLGLLGHASPVSLTSLPNQAYLGLLFMAVFSSIVAYFLFEWSLKAASVSDTALMAYLTPVMTAPFAFFLLGELPTVVGLFGGIIITSGVIVAEMASHELAKQKSLIEKLGFDKHQETLGGDGF